VPPDPCFGRYVRERVQSFAAGHRIPDADAVEFVTAVSEALANAVEHSRSEDTIEITCWIAGGDQLIATIVDHGVGFPAEVSLPRAVTLPDPLAERGRGLSLMRRYTDLLSVRSTPGKGTSVVLSRYVRARRADDVSAAMAG
jgi:stage II sporulation protein AB (anti-sigma F factor)